MSDRYFVTYTGIKFYPLNPQPEHVDVRDIAHALSLICRFGGHTRHHYSVADHSLRCMNIATAHGRRMQLLTLMHDASEAYLGDMVRPLKIELPDYLHAEKMVTRVIWQALGIEPPTVAEHEIIKRIDNTLLVTEARDLITNHDWIGHFIERPLDERIVPCNYSEYVFLGAYERLRAEGA